MTDKDKRFQFTPENLIENIHRIGAWSAYGLASCALQHYFPESYDEGGYCDPMDECKLLEKLGCQYWEDVIVKYQKEVGYNAPQGFDTDCVNEY